MKANKAPEKLYLNPLLMEDGESIVRRCTFERQRNSQIEYTRTDAFIEKACEFLAGNMKCDGYTLQTKAKFIRGFRNYMKGE